SLLLLAIARCCGTSLWHAAVARRRCSCLHEQPLSTSLAVCEDTHRGIGSITAEILSVAPRRGTPLLHLAVVRLFTNNPYQPPWQCVRTHPAA
ncbi:MAG: hypothetical protein RMJ87_09305, partial [Cytophagales bacterium]|nr:hypothetical protein [Cytophagales bacterium]